MDPGSIAALIFIGIPTATIGLVGGSRAVRGVVGWRHARRVAQLEARTPWTVYREHREDGSVAISIQRKSDYALYEREQVRVLPPGTPTLEIDVARWETKAIAAQRNEEEGRRVRSRD